MNATAGLPPGVLPQARRHIRPDIASLADAVAIEIARQIRASTRLRLVLAGGATPRPVYEALAAMPEIGWGRVEILFGDERCVKPDDPRSNYAMAKAALLDHVAPLAVQRIPAELGPERAALAYEPAVAVAPLDLVLLGLGADGHVASLFPGHPALAEGGSVVPVRCAPADPPERVSLSLAALRAARRVLFIVSGPGKRAALERAWRGEIPAGALLQADWYVTANTFDGPDDGSDGPGEDRSSSTLAGDEQVSGAPGTYED